MAAIIGIDLGTTNSVLAYLDDSGDPRILDNEFGQNITPSAVFWDSNERIVGTEALRMQQFQPDSVATEFKRDMGTDKVYELPGGNMTPIELSAVILKSLGEHAVNQFGDLGQVVVTTPANFGNPAREATRSAGELAGFEMGPEINEPTAAALYYAYTQKDIEPGTYFVYDFGGGTWDISAVRINGTDIEVLWSEGIQECGGSDLDSELKNLIGELYRAETGEDIDESLNTQLSYEGIKKSLSQREQLSATIQKPNSPPVTINVTREQFEAKISFLLAQTEIICEDMVERYPDFIDVFMVGGTSRVPRVEKSVEKIFKKPARKVANPDEVIALGAAIYSGLKAPTENLNPAQAGKMESVTLQLVANHYFGMAAISYDSVMGREDVKNSTVIPKGRVVPCKVTQTYYTRENTDSLMLQITQSRNEETELENVEIIWEGSLPVPGGRPAGLPVEVTYEYTEDQRMKCNFLDVDSGETTEVDLSVKDLSDDSSVDKFFIE